MLHRLIFNFKYPSRLILVPLEYLFSNIQDFFLEKKYLKKKDLINIYKSKFIKRSAISDYINFFFEIVIKEKPNLIVELGVNMGFSTRAFLAGLHKNKKGKLISVDIEDFGNLNISKKFRKKWLFFHENDIDFSKKFQNICSRNKIKPKINILFIDTSHEYQHTLKELKVFEKYMSKNSLYIFHDSNLNWYYFRKDGTIGFAFDNNRGVVRAIEKYFSVRFNEKNSQKFHTKKYNFEHYHFSCGMTKIKVN